MLNSIFSKTELTQRALEAATIRKDVISQNIANDDTPGYKRKSVSFEEFLNAAEIGQGMSGYRTNPRHISIGKHSVMDVPISISEDNSDTNMRLDGNNVDMDNEMSQLAKNQIKYNALIEQLNAQFNSLKTAIKEGRG